MGHWHVHGYDRQGIILFRSGLCEIETINNYDTRPRFQIVMVVGTVACGCCVQFYIVCECVIIPIQIKELKKNVLVTATFLHIFPNDMRFSNVM